MSETNRPQRKPKPTARIPDLADNMLPTFDFQTARKAVEKERKRVMDIMQNFGENQDGSEEEKSK